MDTRQVCTFLVDDLLLGVETNQVREVLRFQEITRVPLAPAAVTGLMNLRGEIVTVIDLRTRLELPRREDDRPPMNVVTRIGDATVSLLVDEIGDVIEVTKDLYEPAPEHLSGVARELIQGTYKLEERLLLMLDVEKTVELDKPASFTAGVQTAQKSTLPETSLQ